MVCVLLLIFIGVVSTIIVIFCLVMIKMYNASLKKNLVLYMVLTPNIINSLNTYTFCCILFNVIHYWVTIVNTNIYLVVKYIYLSMHFFRTTLSNVLILMNMIVSFYNQFDLI